LIRVLWFYSLGLFGSFDLFLLLRHAGRVPQLPEDAIGVDFKPTHYPPKSLLDNQGVAVY